MANFSAIRDQLKVRLATIPGMRAHDTIPDQINPPAAVVSGFEAINYDVTMARAADQWLIPIRVYAGRVSDRASQDALDKFLAAEGAESVKAAVEGDVSLGGVAQTTRIQEARNYGSYTLGDIGYLGAEWLVEVIA